MALRIYNTLTREKEPFEPRKPGAVSIYQCGPTVYAPTHIGHLRPLVTVDVMVRYFEAAGYEVIHVENFTDVDDKIIERAQEEGLEPLELAGQYVDEYLDITRRLGVRPADEYPRVSEHIPLIIEMVQELIDRGYAYEVDGDVYFAVARFDGYGKLSRRRIDEMEAGARVAVDERKRHPADFALWKASRPGEPSWDSPWGEGRPGWHIECSAMSLHYLGHGFDIHVGGRDLVFPHHENEIAQSEAYAGAEPFVRYWVHNGLCHFDEEKMSKSLGNSVEARDILRRYRPEIVRFFLISSHYRSPQSYSDELMEEAARSWQRLANAWIRLQEQRERWTHGGAESGEPEETPAEALRERVAQSRANFEAAMQDDFNTALAIGELFELVRSVNQYLNDPPEVPSAADVKAVDAAYGLLHEAGSLLGIKDIVDAADAHDDHRIENLIELVVEVREEVRRNQDFALADRIRSRLAEVGVRVEDTPHGSRWTWER